MCRRHDSCVGDMTHVYIDLRAQGAATTHVCLMTHTHMISDDTHVYYDTIVYDDSWET
jgi:hypothetical protein